VSLLTRVEAQWRVTYGSVKLQKAAGKRRIDTVFSCTIDIYNPESDLQSTITNGVFEILSQGAWHACSRSEAEITEIYRPT